MFNHCTHTTYKKTATAILLMNHFIYLVLFSADSILFGVRARERVWAFVVGFQFRFDELFSIHFNNCHKIYRTAAYALRSYMGMIKKTQSIEEIAASMTVLAGLCDGIFFLS